MTPRKKSSRLVAALGTLGYASLLMQWMWMAVVSGYALLMDKNHSWTKIQSAPAQPQPEMQFSLPSPLAVIIAAIITLVIIIATIYVLAKLPRAIGKTGARVTRTTSDALTPLVTNHKPVTPKQRRVISYRLGIAIKMGLVVVPLAVSLLPYPAVPLEYRAVAAMAIIMASFSAGYFALQYLTAHLKQVDRQTIW